MIRFQKLENGFEYFDIENSVAEAKIALQGAHMFEYTRKDEKPLLWLSGESDFELGKAIRGGVPVCWPSFGMNNPDLPQHGFARTVLWSFVSTCEMDENTTELILELKDSVQTRELWKYAFHLQIKYTISKNLKIELTTVNMDTKAFTITQALHSYFLVSNIGDVRVLGLENKPYLDALNGATCIQEGEIIFNQEVDRVYQDVENEIILQDAQRRIMVKNEGSSSCVVWNPWMDKCKRMSAMSSEAYKEFICIESANAYDDFKVLEAGEAHTLQAIIA